MIAIFQTFTDAIDKLPKEIKARILDAFMKYQKEPSLAGLNLEKIKAHDQDVYSIRVNDNYRIICKIYDQNHLCALYAGKHDDAYDWANTHTVSIDGAGIISVTEAAQAVSTKKEGKRVSRLDALTDQEMEELGIEAAYRSQLREKVFLPKHLLGFKQLFSEETYVVLEEILNGNDKNEALDFYRDMKRGVIQPDPTNEPLFDISPDDLSKIGVPADKIDLVSSVRSIEQFRSIQSMLPPNAAEALYKYIDGTPLAEIISTIRKRNTPADEDRIDEVINNIGSRQVELPLDGQVDLEKLFSMPMEKWRVFLHPEQRRIAEASFNGPARVIGGAGTGKTVVIVHRAKELAKRCSEKKCILVTTFSRTLADDIETRLSQICSSDELEKIDVKTFDSVSKEYCRSIPPYSHIVYDKPFFKNQRNPYDTPLRRAWGAACKTAQYHEFDFDFYVSEWRDVFQGQKVSTRVEYLKVKRKGKGNKKLNIAARERVFDVVTLYQEYMKQHKWIDIDWAQNYCAERIPGIPSMPLYKHILVDECQDFTSAAFRLLRALAGPEHSDDIFLAGDSRQRIYNGHSSLSSCGIVVNNRSFQIKVNYRTTREIYDLSLKIQKGYKFDNLDDSPIEKDESIPTMHGESPIIKGFLKEQDEIKAVIESVKKRIQEGYSASEICIVSKLRKTAESFASTLKKQGIDSLFLDNDQSDDKTIAGVRTATMHRVKGMEFDCMYIVSANDGLLPYKKEYENPNNDDNELLNILKREANLLSVAVTRARRTVWLSYWGSPTVLLKGIKTS